MNKIEKIKKIKQGYENWLTIKQDGYITSYGSIPVYSQSKTITEILEILEELVKELEV